jgi:hypothetical protein
VPWVEIFAVFTVSHLVGDFALQTGWQAKNKWGGLGPDQASRRALLTHGATYGLAFVPALVWLADDLGAGVLAVAALILGPHVIQDDGRLLDGYMRAVKHTDAGEIPVTRLALDQSLHLVALLAVAVVAGG